LKVQSDRNEIPNILDGGGLTVRRATTATSEVREWVSSSWKSSPGASLSRLETGRWRVRRAAARCSKVKA
jgi:hypothetical protein